MNALEYAEDALSRAAQAFGNSDNPDRFGALRAAALLYAAERLDSIGANSGAVALTKLITSEIPNPYALRSRP